MVSLAAGACNDAPTGANSSNDQQAAPHDQTAPQFANNSNQRGLVNVSTGDVALLNNVNLAVAANVIATVCGVTIPVAALAEQVVGVGAFDCTGTAGPITVDQATPGQPS